MLFFTFGQSLLDYFLFTFGQSFFTTENSSKGTGNSLHIFLSRNRPALKKQLDPDQLWVKQLDPDPQKNIKNLPMGSLTRS